MSRLKLETLSGQTDYLPRDEIEISAGWELEEPPEAIEVRLVWYTRGKGEADISVVER